MHILAAVVDGSDLPMTIKSLRLDAPRSDEVLVRLVGTGICHTDATMWQQGVPVPQPVVLGHEGAGIVEAVGDGVLGIAPGDHVVMSFNSCGHCSNCRDDAASYCEEFFPRNFFGTRPDGSTTIATPEGEVVHGNIFGQSSFATYALCHQRNAVKVPDDFDLRIAGPLGCGLLTGAGAVINAFKLTPGKSIVVMGAGSVGLAAVMAAAARGAGRIIAVDLHRERLELAGTLGATDIVDASAENTLDAVMAMLPAGVDFVLDCTGAAKVIEQGIAMLALRGTCGIVGAAAPGTPFSADISHVMSGGRTIRGIVEGDADPKTFIIELIALHQAGRFPFEKLIRFYPFAEINQAFADAEHGRTIKPVLLF